MANQKKTNLEVQKIKTLPLPFIILMEKNVQNLFWLCYSVFCKKGRNFVPPRDPEIQTTKNPYINAKYRQSNCVKDQSLYY